MVRNFSFNGIVKDYLVVLKGSNREPWAPVSWTYQEIANRPGAYARNRKLQPRPLPIPVGFKVKEKSKMQKLKEELAAWLIQSEPKPLIFDDEPDRTYYAIVDGTFDIEEFLRIGQGTIPFICPDPLKYGTEKTQTVTTSPINNLGTFETTPSFIVTFTKAATEFKITHQETGKWIRVIYNFIAGDKLVIDLAKRKITVNNVVRMTSYDWRSQPFMLLPGSNRFTIAPSSVATTQIKFNERWL